MKLGLHAFFDAATSSLTYVAWDERTRDAIVIDPVLDFEPATRALSRHSIADVHRLIKKLDLNVHWILDTHAHADHLTAGRELRAQLPGARWAVAAALDEVLDRFRGVFAWPAGLSLGDLGVDRFLKDGEEIVAGSLRLEVIATPGHTPACLTFRLEEWLFTGDAIFLPDGGVGRCDFPGGSAGRLYDSIHGRLYALPDHYLTLVGHDYQPGGRPLRYSARLGEQKAANVHLRAGTSREEFIAFREARDRTLKAPRLLDPALDWNLGANRLVPRGN